MKLSQQAIDAEAARLCYNPRWKSTREEVQAFVEFTDKWMPSAKRRSTGSGNDDEEESE